jgi:zinc dependent phospholipase C
MMCAALILLVLCSALAAPWGPGNHLEFEARVFRRRKELLPRHVAHLLDAQRPAFQYGNIAADLINFKAFGGAYNSCHRWSIVEDMRNLATKPEEEAFILGYLAHLAADTIAHNHFVPYHLARYARGRSLGHLYWEMNADRFVPEERWQVVSQLKSLRQLDELDELVNRTVPRKALSMGTNKLIFSHVLLVSEREQWRQGISRIHPLSQLSLRKGFLEMFRDAAVQRVILALGPRGISKLEHIDTSGKQAQKDALKLRARLRNRPDHRCRTEEAEVRAMRFLEGMQSPP